MIGIALFLLSAEPGEAYVPFGIDSMNMRMVGYLVDTSRNGFWRLAVTEDMNYAYTYDAYLVIIDMRDKENPRIARVIDSIKPWALLVKDTLLFLIWNHFTICDISDPLNPVPIGHCDSVYGREDLIYLEGLNRVCIADWKVTIIDVSNPTSPKPTCTVTLGGTVPQACYVPPYLYVIKSDTPYSHAYIFELKVNPDSLKLLNRIDHWTPNNWDYGTRTIAAWKDDSSGRTYLYCLGGTVCYVFDVTDPLDPITVNYGKMDPTCNLSRVDGHLLYSRSGWLGQHKDGITICDPKMDPAFFPIVGFYRWSELGGEFWDIWDLRPKNGWIFVSATLHNFRDEMVGASFGIFYTPLGAPGTSICIPETFRVVVTYPGPRLCLTLYSKSNVSLSLYDAGGRLAIRKDLGRLNPGSHAIPLGHNLAQGVYFLQVNINEKRFLEKVVIK
ncbi:MAG: T9SS type A sorting domain-containing protein [candidate division WOR-3 bacterium]